ncbi:hypothetical protein [Nitrobacter sp. Nb-311A]|uniref:hypothetical protein n=1 Tax=Nitrobacter sp. Nb-311A TaxID=314253 RepID=UPI0035270D88
MAAARKASSIVVFKLDRLSRDVAFVSGLQAKQVHFVVPLPSIIRSRVFICQETSKGAKSV